MELPEKLKLSVKGDVYICTDGILSVVYRMYSIKNIMIITAYKGPNTRKRMFVSDEPRLHALEEITEDAYQEGIGRKSSLQGKIFSWLNTNTPKLSAEQIKEALKALELLRDWGAKECEEEMDE